MIVGARNPIVGTLTLQPGQTASGTFGAVLPGTVIAVQATVSQVACEVRIDEIGQAEAPTVVPVPVGDGAGLRRVTVPVTQPDIRPGRVRVTVAATTQPVDVALSAGGFHIDAAGTPMPGELHVLLLVDAETVRDVPDDTAALRALPRAQRALLTTPTATVRSVDCGWHGSLLDDRTPAVALAAEDGPLADLIGGRIRVTSVIDPRRQVVVLLADAGDIVEDLSLCRRAFLELGPLWTEEVAVRVELLS